MSAGFRVDPDALDRSARQVDALAGRIRAAAGAGEPLALGAYGLVGQVFALAAAYAASAGSAAVAGLAERAAEHGTQLRVAAAGYRRTEQSMTAGLGGPR
jgi:hypothetical protein